MEQPLIVLVVILAVALGVMFYSLFLQKAATTRQAKNMQSIQESIEQQNEGIRLQKENNDLLREILKTLKGRNDA
jgi:cell division protein FtsL